MIEKKFVTPLSRETNQLPEKASSTQGQKVAKNFLLCRITRFPTRTNTILSESSAQPNSRSLKQRIFKKMCRPIFFPRKKTFFFIFVFWKRARSVWEDRGGGGTKKLDFLSPPPQKEMTNYTQRKSEEGKKSEALEKEKCPWFPSQKWEVYLSSSYFFFFFFPSLRQMHVRT